MAVRTRDLVLLYGLGVLVNGGVALLVSRPGYMDVYYYLNGGLIIAQGGPLVEPYLWNYVHPPPDLPVPAFGYWQPMASFLAALGILVFGRSAAFGAAQAVFVLLAAVLPILTYLLGESLGERRHALLAGLLTVFSSFYVIYWSLPETFTPFALFGSLSLLLAGYARMKGKWWVWSLSGMSAALAHLTRADGLLLVGIVGLAAVLPPFNKPRSNEAPSTPTFAQRLGFAALSIVGYVIVMSPWFTRNLRVFGSLQAPGGLDTLWLLGYNDLFTYPPELSPARFFASGLAAIWNSRWEALVGNLQRFVAEQNAILLTPLTIIGLARRWRDDRLLPAVLYVVALFAAMTFAFPHVGVRGGYFHSGGALIPFFSVAAALGLDDTLRWTVRRLRHWRFEQARRVFGASLVAMSALLTAYLVAGRIVGLPFSGTTAWNHSHDVYAEIGATLDQRGVPPDARVMSNTPPAFYFYTGRGGIPLVNGDEANLLQAADAYHVTFLVLDSNVPDGLQSLYQNGPQSARLVLVDTYDSPRGITHLYRIDPPG